MDINFSKNKGDIEVMVKQERCANIELLRIISMLMIVMLHFLMHGQILKWSSFGSIDYAVYWIIEAFVFVSVNVFVLISGYFLCLTQFQFSRIIKIWLQVLFYSIMCTLVCIILGGVLTSKNLLKMILPISTNEYWFVTAYVLMLCVSPFVNKAIANMNRKQHVITVYSIVLLFCLMPTFLVWERDLITKGMDYTWFVVLYIIASYIRKYGIPEWLTMKRCMAIYVICSLVTGGMRIPLGILSNHFGFGYTLSGLFFRYNSICIAVASLALFCFFLKLKISCSILKRGILFIAPLTFAVYLIHEHPMVRDLLWNSLPMKRWFMMGIPETLFYMCMTVICVFAISCLIERVRLCLFELFKINALILVISQGISRFITHR